MVLSTLAAHMGGLAGGTHDPHQIIVDDGGLVDIASMSMADLLKQVESSKKTSRVTI